ncbi:MAG: hypothetical protein WKF79_12760 [Nocardioides sp.]
MNRKTKAAVAAGAIVIASGATAGVAVATGGGDDNEAAITGDALERASAAALEHTGEGTVSDTEVGDEESYYEVEVTLDNGDEVDVQLDEDFSVVSSEGENENENEDENEDENGDD